MSAGSEATLSGSLDAIDAAVKADLAHVIHPLSALRELDASDLQVFTAGQGLRLQDIHGRQVLDAVSGLWNVTVGYGRAELARVRTVALVESHRQYL